MTCLSVVGHYSAAPTPPPTCLKRQSGQAGRHSLGAIHGHKGATVAAVAKLRQPRDGVRDLVRQLLGVLHDDVAAGVQQRRRVQQREELGVGDEQVGRADGDKVKGAAGEARRGGGLGQKILRAHLVHRCARRQAGELQVGLQHVVDHPGVQLDEVRVRGAAAEALEPDRARAGEEVQPARALRQPVAAQARDQRVEDRPAHLLHHRPRQVAHLAADADAAGSSRDDAQAALRLGLGAAARTPLPQRLRGRVRLHLKRRQLPRHVAGQGGQQRGARAVQRVIICARVLPAAAQPQVRRIKRIDRPAAVQAEDLDVLLHRAPLARVAKHILLSLLRQDTQTNHLDIADVDVVAVVVEIVVGAEVVPQQLRPLVLVLRLARFLASLIEALRHLGVHPPQLRQLGQPVTLLPRHAVLLAGRRPTANGATATRQR
mmetsp:Transcript_9275/g.23444  ORF Transcript_9275/g.23444 Transcript_9275/m.23444 type:complete len:431 (-) Transcript_9275:187-1479(-)